MILSARSRMGTKPLEDEVCGALSGILRGGVDIHRCLAAQALGRIGQPAAVGPLMEALLDEDEDVRTDAAGALSGLADPRAGGQLLENLIGDPCTDVKLAAIDALVRMRDADIVPWLRRLVRGRDEDIAWDDEEFYASGWDDWVDVQVKAIDALAEMGIPDAVPDILEAMEDDQGQDISETAFAAFARLGKSGIEALAGFLGETDERYRRRAAAALAGTDAEEARTVLDRALADRSPEVRLAALRPLAAKDPEDKRLAALLDDPDPEVRAEAVRLVGRHYSDRLGTLVNDGAAAVKEAALGVLAETPDLAGIDGVLEAVRRRLDSPRPETAAAAAAALATIDPAAAFDPLAALLGDTERPVEARLGALRAMAKTGGEDMVPVLVEAVRDDHRTLRLEAMMALAAIARAEAHWPNLAGEALLSALKGDLVPEPEKETAGSDAPRDSKAAAGAEETDSDVSFPTSTMQSILGNDNPAAEIMDLPEEGVELTPDDMERLAIAQRNPRRRNVPVTPLVAPHEDVRRFAARVLGDIGCEEVALALAAALKDGDPSVRLAAADSLALVGESLSALPDGASEALLAALPGAERNLGLSVVRALTWADGERVGGVLTGCLRDDDSFVRTEAVRALARIGRTGPETESLLDDPEPGVRLAAAQATADAGGTNAVALLVDFAFAFEGYHRREAARLLRGLDAAGASARFLDVLAETDRMRVWPVAIEALEELNRSDPSGGGKAVTGTEQELERKVS